MSETWSGYDTSESNAESPRLLRSVIVRLGVIGFVFVIVAAPALAGHDKTDVANDR